MLDLPAPGLQLRQIVFDELVPHQCRLGGACLGEVPVERRYLVVVEQRQQPHLQQGVDGAVFALEIPLDAIDGVSFDDLRDRLPRPFAQQHRAVAKAQPGAVQRAAVRGRDRLQRQHRGRFDVVDLDLFNLQFQRRLQIVFRRLQQKAAADRFEMLLGDHRCLQQHFELSRRDAGVLDRSGDAALCVEVPEPVDAEQMLDRRVGLPCQYVPFRCLLPFEFDGARRGELQWRRVGIEPEASPRQQHLVQRQFAHFAFQLRGAALVVVDAVERCSVDQQAGYLLIRLLDELIDEVEFIDAL